MRVPIMYRSSTDIPADYDNQYIPLIHYPSAVLHPCFVCVRSWPCLIFLLVSKKPRCADIPLHCQNEGSMAPDFITSVRYQIA